jgi:Flp pilus assembly protein TadG
VEFALALPLLIALMMGIVDFGLILSESIGVTQGVREAARAAAAGEVGTVDCAGDINGTVADPNTRAIICRTKDRVGEDPGDTRVRVVVDDVDGDGNGDYAAGNYFAVCAMYPMVSASGLFDEMLADRHQTGRVVMRIDDDSLSGGFSTGGESALSGTSWSFCTVDD